MQIIARYTKTLYEKGDFLIGTFLKLEKNKKEFIKVKGYSLPKTDVCFYKFNGEYENTKYGKTFVVKSYELTQLKTIGAVKGFFKNDEFQGLGKVIKKVINVFGTDTITVVSDNPEKLNEVSGINQEQITALISAMQRVNSLQAITKRLSPLGISNNQIKRINEEFHENAIRLTDENPFALMNGKGIGFKTCDTIARYLNIALDSYERIQGGVLETLYENALNGNTYMVDKDLISKSLFKLNDSLPTAVVTRQDIIDVIWDMIQKQSIYNIKEKIFAKSYFESELKIAELIKAMMANNVSNADAMVSELSDYPMNLSQGQMKAVKTSLSNRFSIITGGAGTGKTTVMKAIIYAYEKQNSDKKVVLLAPTGKASRRISEVTGKAASTIHSALGLCCDEDIPGVMIINSLVIIDEFSMVDTLLFKKLLMAVSTITCHVVLLGDPNQLPSIGAGECLKDLIDSNVVPVSHLTEIFRQNGGVIIDNSIKTIHQKTEFEYSSDMLFVTANSDLDATNQIKTIYKYYCEKVGIDNVALITPLRRQVNNNYCVADELNSIIQSVINNAESEVCIGEKKYKLNDRVMMWKNTPIASNGDVGTITAIDTENEDWEIEVTIEWENGETGKYHKIDFEDITLAYAISVHKSQGSEYDTVIVPVLSAHKCKLFKNNLLYTAITRAKKRVILVGDKKALNTMITNTETNKRLTNLKQFLIKA